MAYFIGDIFGFGCKRRPKYLLAQGPEEPIRVTQYNLRQGLALMFAKFEF